MAREEVLLREVTTAELSQQLQDLRRDFTEDILTHDHLAAGNSQTLGGTVVGDLQSSNFIAGSSGWQIKGTGSAQFADLTLIGGVIRFGKTSFTDSSNAGYFMSSAGVYFGAASDTTAFKFNIGTGAFDFIGTVSSRSTATIASAIDSSGDLVTDIINARLDTASKKILSGFDFGTADYAGAVKTGDIAWNETTGAVSGGVFTVTGSGVAVTRNGIVGAINGAVTFSIDASTGNATFAGTLVAAGGTFGTITSGSLTGLTITGGTIQTATSGGKRIVMTGNVMEFYNATPTNVASLNGGALGASTFLNINVPSGAGFYPITIVQNEANFQVIEIALKAASKGIFIFNESTAEAIHLKGKVSVVNPLLYLEQDGTGIPLEILLTANANALKITSTAALTDMISLNVGDSGRGIMLNLLDTTNSSAAFEINHDGTGRGLYIHLDKTANTNHGLLIQHLGTGAVAEFEAVSNGSRTTATVNFLAVSGQGAHFNLNPIVNAPGSPTSGDIYYDTDGHFYGYNGSSWLQLDN